MEFLHNMKFFFITRLANTPWGGGHQFLRALKTVCAKTGHVADTPKQADVIVCNSYQDIPRALFLRWRYSKKTVLHRLGPIFFLHRGQSWKRLDRAVLLVAARIADVVVFQSAWSRDQAYALGFPRTAPSVIIGNAADGSVFYPRQSPGETSGKIKLIAVSWSDNPKKGYDLYRFLDEYLDASRYEMLFVGPPEIRFTRIQNLGRKTSAEIAELLRSSDIFVSGVQDDACSNAILEALTSGLPVVAVDSGANKEIIGAGGIVVSESGEMVCAIDDIASHLGEFKSSISPRSIDTVARMYEEVAEKAAPKPALSFFGLLYLLFRYYSAMVFTHFS